MKSCEAVADVRTSAAVSRKIEPRRDTESSWADLLHSDVHLETSAARQTDLTKIKLVLRPMTGLDAVKRHIRSRDARLRVGESSVWQRTFY